MKILQNIFSQYFVSSLKYFIFAIRTLNKGKISMSNKQNQFAYGINKTDF